MASLLDNYVATQPVWNAPLVDQEISLGMIIYQSLRAKGNELRVLTLSVNFQWIHHNVCACWDAVAIYKCAVLFIHVFSINTKTHIQNIFNNQSLDRNQPESIFDAFDEEVSIF